jgi:hypothetical protein
MTNDLFAAGDVVMVRVSSRREDSLPEFLTTSKPGPIPHIESCRVLDRYGTIWPPVIANGNGHAPRNRQHKGWCYGTSGIARALHLAGQAVGDREFGDGRNVRPSTAR